MVSFPPHSWCLLVRTDFTDDEGWARLVQEATTPSPEGFEANVRPFSDPAADGAAWETLRDTAMAAASEEYSSVLFVADTATIASPDQPNLVVSTSRFYRDRHPEEFAAMRPFRCIPSELWSVENNLNLANMDWHDFARRVNGAGVFRGF